MPCPIFNLALPADAAAFDEMLAARLALSLGENDDAGIEAKVQAIIDNVRKNGLAAVLEYTRDFDCESFKEEQLVLGPRELAHAAAGVDPEDLKILHEAIANIRRFHEAQKSESWFQTRPDGSIMGQMVIPVGRAGLYVPGGRGGNTPLISSLLMTAIPAQVAGVPQIALVTPPRPDGSVNPHILAAAHLLGLAEVYACGSAWAVAALAFGAGPIRPVDVIAGPGNIWVATAKRLLIGQVGIDMVAGPSEVVIIADDSADPDFIAADLLAQAEHDHLASAICITASVPLASKIRSAVARQLKDLPRAEMAAKSLHNWGGVVMAANLREALELSNRIAPEHLEIFCRDPWSLLPYVKNAGAVFLGAYSAEALGDYYAGPNHVLPTLGNARFSSALGVHNFCKKTSVISASKSFASEGAAAVARLARLEQLEGHARSAELRGK